MEIIFNKTKKVMLVLALTLVFISITTTIFAANTFNLNISSAKMYEGEKISLTATNGVTWSTSNDAVATVDRNGKVTAKKKGDVIITAEKNGEKQTCKVKVKKLDKLTKAIVGKPFNVSEITLYEGQKFVINGANPKNWKTTNKYAATVSSGTVTGVKAGIAIISAKVDKKLVTCSVIVKKAPKIETSTTPSTPPAPAIPSTPSQPAYNIRDIFIYRDNTDITQSKTTIGVKEVLGLKAVLTGTNTQNATVTWKIANADKSKATINSNGQVTGEQVGTAKIIAQVGDKSTYCTINIVPGTFVFETITNSKNTENLTIGADGEKYALAVSENTLKTKLNQIYTYNISQDRGERIAGKYTKDKCIRIATYHNYMLLGKISSPNIDDALSLSIYNSYNARKKVDTDFDANKNKSLDGISTTEGTEAYNFYNTIKTHIDAGYPIRLKVKSNTGSYHYVTIVGYELELNAHGNGQHGNGIPDSLNDLLIIGSFNGKLFNGENPKSSGKGDIYGGFWPEYHLDIYKK